MPPEGNAQTIEDAVALLAQHVPYHPSYIDQPNRRIQKGRVRGTWKALVVLIDFPDYPWDTQADSNFVNNDTLYTPGHFDDMLFSRSTYKDPLSQSAYTGSMRDFYLENSYGQFEVVGVTTIWYRAAHPYSYYANTDGIPGTLDDYGFGSYPHNAQRLVEEAVALADSAVDFSQFDNDGDGWVDSFFIVHAGPGAEAIYTQNFPAHYRYLWSHAWSISPEGRDGVTISDYTLQPEDGTIGVFCHEYGHALGLPDLYDYDRSSEGVGEWDLMGSGGWCFRKGDRLGTSPSHLSAWCKARLGWLLPVNLTRNLAEVRLPPVELEPVVYRLWRDGLQGPEYFLIENSQNLGFDAGLTRRQKSFNLADAYGLMIYHVDEIVGNNDNEARKMIDVEEASAFIDSSGKIFENLDHPRDLRQYQFLNRGNRGDNGDPFPGFSQINADWTDLIGPRDRNAFNDSTIPNSRDNDGGLTGVRVENIRFDGLDMLADLFIAPVTTVARLEDRSMSPAGFELGRNFPNPFSATGAGPAAGRGSAGGGNPSTTIGYALPEIKEGALHVTLKIYNSVGQEVATLVDKVQTPGRYTARWNGIDHRGRRVPSGVYFCKLQAGDFSGVQKMLLLP